MWKIPSPVTGVQWELNNMHMVILCVWVRKGTEYGWKGVKSQVGWKISKCLKSLIRAGCLSASVPSSQVLWNGLKLRIASSPKQGKEQSVGSRHSRVQSLTLKICQLSPTPWRWESSCGQTVEEEPRGHWAILHLHMFHCPPWDAAVCLFYPATSPWYTEDTAKTMLCSFSTLFWFIICGLQYYLQ